VNPSATSASISVRMSRRTISLPPSRPITPLRAYYQRIRSRRGHGKAIVAAARKLVVLFWCMLTRGQDYAHQQPSLTAQKLRRLDIAAGAPTRKGKSSGVWVTHQRMRQAEKELAAQAQAS
jgi:transposase